MNLKSLLLGLALVGCVSMLVACGGSTTTTPTPNPTPTPTPQGLQVENHNLSIVAVTRIGVEDIGSGNTNYHLYAVNPGLTGPVISLTVGNYNYWAEYVVSGIFQFTQAFGFSVSSNAVTFRTILIQ